MAAQPLPQRSHLSSSRRAGSHGVARGRGPARDRAVGSMAAKVARPCQRNDCPAPARAGVELSSTEQVAVIVDLPTVRDPRRMELCSDHAARMSVPLGWERTDQRTQEPADVPTGPPSVAEITSLSTLEVLTAALAPTQARREDPGVVALDDPDEPSVAAVLAAALASPVAAVDSDEQSARDDAADVDDVVAAQHLVAQGDVGEASEVVDASDPVDDPDVDEEMFEGGTQLVLAAAARLARRARPVPAALDD